jgi:hypothetical protein
MREAVCLPASRDHCRPATCAPAHAPHYLVDQPRNGLPGLWDGMTVPPCSSHDLGGGVTAPGGIGRPLIRGMTTDFCGKLGGPS